MHTHTHIYVYINNLVHKIYAFFFIIQRVKARAIPCPHQPPTRGDNTVSVAQGGTTTPGATKQLPSSCGDARGVVVIAVGNEHGDTSSNPGRD